MKFISKYKYHCLVWLILFLLSLSSKLIGIDYGLPYEHNPNEHAYFGKVDIAINEGKLDPGVQQYGYVYYYLAYFTSIFTRLLVSPIFVQEYQALFFRILISIISSATVVVVYEIARRIYQLNPKSRGKERILCFLPAAFLAVSVGAVTVARFATPDNIIAFILTLITLSSVIYLNSKNNKSLILMTVLAAMVVSLKFSYAIFLFYPTYIFLLDNNFKFKQFFKLLLRKKVNFQLNNQKKLLMATKYIFLAGLSYLLVNFFALFHLKTWLGLNYFVLGIYSTSNHFYFKYFHFNYLESLATYVKFIFSDLFLVTNVSLYLSLILFSFFIYQCFKVYQTKKITFLALIVFPLLVLIFSAKAIVFQIRNALPIAPFFLLIFFYPTKLTRHLIFKVMFMVGLSITLLSTYNRMIDVKSHNPEKQLMNFIENNQGIYALPNILYYPQILYAYYYTHEARDLKDYPFFKNNQNRIIFYRQNGNYLLPNARLKPSAPNPSEDITGILSKVDYFVIEKQVLESMEYQVANRLKLEPTFNQVDMDPNFDIDKLLKVNNFKLAAFYQTSKFETIEEYDPTHSGFIQIYIYKHEK